MRRSPWFAAAALLLAACSTGARSESPGPEGTGTLRVGVERIDGVFVEGFQLSFVVTDPTGQRTTYRWDDLVTGYRLEWPADVGPQDVERWYAGVLVREVPAGEVTVTSKLDLGMEPPGEPCTSRVEVPAGGEVEVRVALTGDARGCPVTVAGDG